MKRISKILKSRLVVVGLAILLQALWWALFVGRLTQYSVFINALFRFVSIGILLYLIRKDENSAYKIAWMILIMGIPLFGGILYVMIGNKKPGKRLAVKMAAVKAEMKDSMAQNQWILKEIQAQDPTAAGNIRYIGEFGPYPVWKNTEVTYYPLGEQMFSAMLEDLKKAEHYIFLEYFIIQEGLMWDWILEILEQKVKEGVDVRLIYDDVGCVSLLPFHYAGMMEEKGIKCLAFNRFIPVVSLVMNNRDHRKIMVIDGHTAYNGGINLADEYINVRDRFGHWKDSAIRLEGDAVWSMTVSFLSMWDFTHSEAEHFTPFRPEPACGGVEGYVQPYHDCPWDREPVGQSVYLHLIYRAKRYIYITTPYLVIDYSLTMALTTAAKSGVDVRIITPHIPDKKTVFELTRCHYEELIEAGVQIFEYEPGFIHSKNFVVDDCFATVGTVNLDYRSMFLHFENGVLLYGTPSVAEIREDFLDTQTKSLRITWEDCQAISLPHRLLRDLLRLFAPLL